MGALQRRRANISLWQSLHRSVLGGTSAPASWRPLDGDGQRGRGGGPRIFGSPAAGGAPASTVALTGRSRRHALRENECQSPQKSRFLSDGEAGCPPRERVHVVEHLGDTRCASLGTFQRR